MITQWNDEEEWALSGLPLAAQVLYLRGIRRHMDYETGICGLKRGISLQGLAEILYVDGQQGMKYESTSKQQVRRLIVWLEKSGLVERRSIEREKLIFFLPLADTHQSAQKKADTKPTQSRHSEADTSESSNLAAYEDKADTKPTQVNITKADTPQITDNRYKEKELTNVSSKKKPARRQKIGIEDWIAPSDRCLELIAEAGIDEDFARSLIGEFRMYWEERGDKRPGWDATFLGHVKNKWERRPRQAIAPIVNNQRGNYETSERPGQRYRDKFERFDDIASAWRSIPDSSASGVHENGAFVRDIVDATVVGFIPRKGSHS